MAAVLSSKHYEQNRKNLDCVSIDRASVNIDSSDLLRTSLSSLDMHSTAVEDRKSRTPRIHKKLLEHKTEKQVSRIAQHEEGRAQLSILALLLAAFRRSGLACRAPREEIRMDIGWPTDAQHVTHVTFDRFNGFLGLPVEFESEIPKRVPSASASVFGVSPESMQCGYDRKGNSVPTILLLLQERLYNQDGLKTEGVFRINAENTQEEQVRRQLNKGMVPRDIDVHCLAGLIKAWFRELPRGVFDSLSPEQIMQCHTEEHFLELVKLLPPTQEALLNWAVNLMADVVQQENFNKMNARNIAMVFAPNMTQMSDPLTALMHAVQVMNFLKSLILKTLQDRNAAVLDPKPASDANGLNQEEQDDASKWSFMAICNDGDIKEDRHVDGTK
eukprot:c6954_g1_i1 orf=771-1931(+)